MEKKTIEIIAIQKSSMANREKLISHTNQTQYKCSYVTITQYLFFEMENTIPFCRVSYVKTGVGASFFFLYVVRVMLSFLCEINCHRKLFFVSVFLFSLLQTVKQNLQDTFQRNQLFHNSFKIPLNEWGLKNPQNSKMITSKISTLFTCRAVFQLQSVVHIPVNDTSSQPISGEAMRERRCDRLLRSSKCRAVNM